MAQQFPLLFSPVKVGNITLRNRIVNTAHGTGFAKDHLITEQHIYYHMERAKGGVGMSIIEATSVHPSYDIGGFNMIWNHDDSIIPLYQRLSKAVHENGAKILTQLSHGGRQGYSGGIMRPVWAPSPVPSPDSFQGASEIPHEMEEEEIAEVVEAFGQAAYRAREGGLDGVELHGGHGNLIQQFMTPWVNQRTDKYGGSLENRLRFAMEAIDSVRKKVGDDYVVGIRISGDEFIDGGLTLDDMKEIARRLAATGKIDYINVSNSNYSDLRSMAMHIPSYYIPPANFSYLWAGIKEAVDIPVIGVGRVNTPELAERILAEGQADMIGMVRELIADPHLPNKAREGNVDDIRACVACMQSCIGRLHEGLHISCIYNPVTGREREWANLEPAAIKKKVMVVGGGPAGLEAARVAAERGHRVTLYEKSGKLGGQVNTAAKAPLRGDFGDIAAYLERQVKRLGVEVVTGVEATQEMILKLNPDAVVVATGSIAFMPDVPGVDMGNSISAREVLEKKIELGEKVVVVDTEGLHPATDVAEFLADRSKKVEIITTKPYVGMEIEGMKWRLLFERLLEKGVVMTPFTGIKEIREDSVVVYNTITDQEREIEGVGTVVFAVGGVAENGLYRSLKGRVKELYAIGDCVAPREVEQAVYEGHKVGRAL